MLRAREIAGEVKGEAIGDVKENPLVLSLLLRLLMLGLLGMIELEEVARTAEGMSLSDGLCDMGQYGRQEEKTIKSSNTVITTMIIIKR